MFLIILHAFFGALKTESAEVAQLGTKVEWEPYHVNTPEGADGIAVRAVSCILTRINQPFQINKMPWARVQIATQHGQLDGFFAASQNNERDTYATLSDLFIPQQRVFYFNKRMLKHTAESYDIDFIKKHVKVSARNGSNALHSIESSGFMVESHPNTQHQLLNMLDTGRIEAVLENSLVFESLIKESNKDMADYLQVTYQMKNMGVYWSHKYLTDNPEFLARFNRNIVPCVGQKLE
ncbi:substrate-binding periplasmic protein [Thalassotalea fusca]